MLPSALNRTLLAEPLAEMLWLHRASVIAAIAGVSNAAETPCNSLGAEHRPSLREQRQDEWAAMMPMIQ